MRATSRFDFGPKSSVAVGVVLLIKGQSRQIQDKVSLPAYVKEVLSWGCRCVLRLGRCRVEAG